MENVEQNLQNLKLKKLHKENVKIEFYHLFLAMEQGPLVQRSCKMQP